MSVYETKYKFLLPKTSQRLGYMYKMYRSTDDYLRVYYTVASTVAILLHLGENMEEVYMYFKDRDLCRLYSKSIQDVGMLDAVKADMDEIDGINQS